MEEAFIVIKLLLTEHTAFRQQPFWEMVTRGGIQPCVFMSLHRIISMNNLLNFLFLCF